MFREKDALTTTPPQVRCRLARPAQPDSLVSRLRAEGYPVKQVPGPIGTTEWLVMRKR